MVVCRMYCLAYAGSEVGCTWPGQCSTVTYLNVCPVWPCGFCVLIVGWATPVLGCQYVSVVWSLTSGPASGVLCYNEDLSRQKPHLLIIMGYKRGVVGLHIQLY